jgi:hypothetical protein
MIVTDFIMHGTPVLVDDNLCQFREFIQFRFPKSKKKRIRKKWSKQTNNWKWKEKERIFKFEDKIIISSKAYELLKDSL